MWSIDVEYISDCFARDIGGITIEVFATILELLLGHQIKLLDSNTLSFQDKHIHNWVTFVKHGNIKKLQFNPVNSIKHCLKFQ